MGNSRDLTELERIARTRGNQVLDHIDPELVLWFVAAARERDELRQLALKAVKALGDFEELFEHGCEVCGYQYDLEGTSSPFFRVFEAKEDIRAALAHHDGSGEGKP